MLRFRVDSHNDPIRPFSARVESDPSFGYGNCEAWRSG